MSLFSFIFVSFKTAVMLTLSTRSNYIFATSEAIDAVIANKAGFTKIEVTVVKNCCSATTVLTYNLATGNNNVFVATGAILESIRYKNLITGQSFDIPNAVTIANTSSFATVTNNINSYLSSHTTGYSNISGTATTTTGGYTYAIPNSVNEFVPVSVTYTLAGLPSTQNFNVTTGTLSLSNEGLYIPVDGDGIYNLIITTYATDNSTVRETNCFFNDVTIKCQVSEKANSLDTDVNKLELLMLHYTLTIGGNCGCNCTELCEIYSRLATQLGILDNVSNYNPCGC
jgi:hypothetical protein